MKNKKNDYILGFGMVSIASGTVKTKTSEKDEEQQEYPVIEIGRYVDNKTRVVGQDTLSDTSEQEDITRLIFTNVESLKVLQKAVNLSVKFFSEKV